MRGQRKFSKGIQCENKKIFAWELLGVTGSKVLLRCVFGRGAKVMVCLINQFELFLSSIMNDDAYSCFNDVLANTYWIYMGHINIHVCILLYPVWIHSKFWTVSMIIIASLCQLVGPQDILTIFKYLTMYLHV